MLLLMFTETRHPGKLEKDFDGHKTQLVNFTLRIKQEFTSVAPRNMCPFLAAVDTNNPISISRNDLKPT